MRMLSWNCQGLGNTLTVRQLQEIHWVYSPDIIFLSETKNRRRYMEDVLVKLGFNDLPRWSRVVKVEVWQCYGRRHAVWRCVRQTEGLWI